MSLTVLPSSLKLFTKTTEGNLDNPLHLFSSLLQCGAVITGRLQLEDISRLRAASSQRDDKRQRNPSHSWKLGGPRSSEAYGQPPRHGPRRVYSFVSLLLSPPVPSLFPSSCAFSPSHHALPLFFFLHSTSGTPSLSQSL